MPVLQPDNTVALKNTPPASAPTDVAERPRVKVIIVDDDNDFRDLAAGELEYLGFEVEGFETSNVLFDAVQNGPRPDVIVLDWKLENELGPSVLSELRKQGIDEPVVFFTGLPTTTYENAALDCGAVDFVDKARGIPILAKRLRRIVEWKKENQSSRRRENLSIGKLELRSELAAAFWDGRNTGLTLTEFNVVHLLATNAGEYVAYRAIYDCVHHEGFIAGDGDNGFRTNVRSLIKRIRNKFRAFDADFSEIENFAALGYRWRSNPALSQ